MNKATPIIVLLVSTMLANISLIGIFKLIIIYFPEVSRWITTQSEDSYVNVSFILLYLILLGNFSLGIGIFSKKGYDYIKKCLVKRTVER